MSTMSYLAVLTPKAEASPRAGLSPVKSDSDSKDPTPRSRTTATADTRTEPAAVGSVHSIRGQEEESKEKEEEEDEEEDEKEEKEEDITLIVLQDLEGVCEFLDWLDNVGDSSKSLIVIVTVCMMTQQFILTSHLST